MTGTKTCACGIRMGLGLCPFLFAKHTLSQGGV